MHPSAVPYWKLPFPSAGRRLSLEVHLLMQVVGCVVCVDMSLPAGMPSELMGVTGRPSVGCSSRLQKITSCNVVGVEL